MKSIHEVDRLDLRWAPSNALPNAYELRSDSDILGTLTWQKAYGTIAKAESSDGCWTFKRTGFFSPKVTVREVGSDTDIAVMTGSLAGPDTLRLRDGCTFRWVATNFWETACAFTDTNGTKLVQFKPGPELLKQTAFVEISASANELPELSLLMLLGWYLLVMMWQDTTIAGITAASAG